MTVIHFNIASPISSQWNDQDVQNVLEQITKLSEDLYDQCLLDFSDLESEGKLSYFCSIKFSDDADVRDLNKTYRHKDKSTNVLSFPDGSLDELDNGDDAIYLGDIILAYETIKNESEDQNKSFEAHLTHLILHGTLHLLGYDHIHEEDAQEMEQLEVALLKRLGYKNPYNFDG